uniref:Nose resistant-to-fluoxetine protein N-terminal domain-containing protein n=1 Tax=Parascaris equorum TaxID=6256 RepID=A0A914RQB9_PAREQ
MMVAVETCFPRQSYRNSKMNFLLLVPLAVICVSEADDLGTLSSSNISQFISSLSHNGQLNETCEYDLSVVCSIRSRILQSLIKFELEVRSVLSKTEDGSQRLQQFHKCVEAARESMFFAAEFPLLYCHGYNAHKKEGLAFGICLPASCDDDRLYDSLSNTFRDLYEHTKFVFYIPFRDSSDRHKKRSERDRKMQRFLQVFAYRDWEYEHYSFMDKQCTRSRMIRQWYQRIDSLAVFFVLIALIALVCVATIYDVRYSTLKTTSQVEQILLAFSAKKNMAMMIRKAKTSNLLIRCLDGLRVTSLFWVIIGHTLWYLPLNELPPFGFREWLQLMDGQKMSGKLEHMDAWQLLMQPSITIHNHGALSKRLCAIRRNNFPQKAHRSTVEFGLVVITDTLDKNPIGQIPDKSCTGKFFNINIHVSAISVYRSYTHYVWQFSDETSELLSVGYWLRFYRHRFLRLWPTSTSTSADYIMFLFSPLFLLALKYSTCCGVFLSCIVTIISCLLNGMQIIRYNFPPTQMLFVQPPIFNQDYM